MSSLRGPEINGHAVRAIRVAAGTTQVGLAKKAGLDHSYVSRLESGQRRYPAPRITKALADALGVPMAAILTSPRVIDHPAKTRAVTV